METVLLINKHVEKVLEDKPSRKEVLDFVDEIKSLEVYKTKITFSIALKKELDTLRNLWRFIHTSELYVDRDRIFLYELPKPLYNWLKTYKLSEIIDQIMLYNAFLYLSSGKYPKVKEHTFSLLKDSLLKNIDLLKSQCVPNDFKNTIKNKTLHHEVESKTNDNYFLEYLYLFFKKFNSSPIIPFLQTDPNPGHFLKNPLIVNTDWENFTTGFYFEIEIHGSQKYYNSLRKSRLNMSPDDEYKDDYLDVWKYFYVNDFDILDNIFENVKVVSRFAKRTNFLWICSICRSNELDFEYEKDEILDQKKMDMLCTKCYMDVNFKRKK